MNTICKRRENTRSSGIGGVSFTQRVKNIEKERMEEPPEEDGKLFFKRFWLIEHKVLLRFIESIP